MPGVSALVCLADLLPTLEEVVPQTGIERVIVTNVFDSDRGAARAGDPRCLIVMTLPEALAAWAPSTTCRSPSGGLNEVALLQYTGGTTGPAKGAVLTHGNLLASSRQSGTLVEVDPEHPDIVIAPMPLYHIYGFTMNMVGTFCVGGQSVLIPDPRDIGGMIETMKAWPFTALAGVNTLFVGLMQHPGFDSCRLQPGERCDCRRGRAGGGDCFSEWQRRTGSEIFRGLRPVGNRVCTDVATVRPIAGRWVLWVKRCPGWK